MLRLENEVLARNEQRAILRLIYAHPITYYKLNTNKKFVPNNNNIGGGITSTTQDYILNSRWL